MNRFLNALLISGLLVGCSHNEQTVDNKNILTFNDFESMAGWIPENATLTREIAHSGEYSIKVDADKEFSLGYYAELGQITPRKPKKIKLEAWAYIESDKSQAQMGMQITDPASGQNVFGDGIVLTDQIKEYRKWTAINKVIALPNDITPTNYIKVFLWRSYVPEAAYLDDVRVSVVE